MGEHFWAENSRLTYISGIMRCCCIEPTDIFIYSSINSFFTKIELVMNAYTEGEDNPKLMNI